MKKSSFIIGTIFGITLTGTSVLALTPIDNSPFKDVPNDHWAVYEVDWAKGWKVMNGFEDGTFGGDKNTTRYELAKTLANYDNVRHPEVSEMKDEMENLKREIKELNLASEGVIPLASSELAPGETSYLVCKSAKYNWIYTSEFPYAPFYGERYDNEGNKIEDKSELNDCVRTTKNFWESIVGLTAKIDQ